MPEKPPHHISSTEFRKQLGHWLDEVAHGEKVTVSRHGKLVATLEATQKSLPLMGLREKQIRECQFLVESLGAKDLDLILRTVRQLLKNQLDEEGK